ncbi:MAG: putative ABC transporter ATP-binding protein [Deltaproteobacteria bacterium ADurb.Bin510]|nr:MAG: putative ABC transporter ATP-binding protein [Deltaproteobacteria bacterium ADurb.Bin510]
MIVIEELRKTFKGQKVLDGVNLKIPTGKTTVIIGPSGTGKSVLLKTIVRLIQPDSGRILVNDINILEQGEAAVNQVRKRCGMCFQDAALFDSMSVGENVAFPLRMHTELQDGEIAERVAELLKVVGLAGIEEKLPSQLSGGMRKRVGIARAMALNPRYMFFDEPTTGLDPIMSNAINTLIAKVQVHTNATSLVISHDIAGAYAIADHMAMIYRGKIIMEGPPDDFKACDDALVRQFLEGRIEGPINTVF